MAVPMLVVLLSVEMRVAGIRETAQVDAAEVSDGSEEMLQW